MIYRFEQFMLDVSTRRLFRQDQLLKVPKRVFDCLHFLVEHRDRVVPRDELIRRVWNRDNVSDHQLAQVVLAARHLLNDNGTNQRTIRTVAGLGYHWVCPVTEVENSLANSERVGIETATCAELDAVSLPPAYIELAADEEKVLSLADKASTRSKDVASRTPWARIRKLLIASSLVLVLAVAAIVGWQSKQAPPMPSLQVVSREVEVSDPLARLDSALWQGRYEEVREGLATLPVDVANSVDARILEIKLDKGRGRFDRATEKLRKQQADANAAGDLIWQAKLLTIESLLNGAAGRAGKDILAPAQLAVELLESAQLEVPLNVMGRALAARGYGLMKTQQLEPAMRDLMRARSLLLKAGDKHGAALSADTLARVHMRMGRLADALALTIEIADYSRLSNAPVHEIYARNAATKILVEQLRWQEALANSDRCMELLHEVPDTERRSRVLQLRVLVLTGLGRMREAASLMEEGETLNDSRYSAIVPATFKLASSHPEEVLALADKAYGQSHFYDDLNLESSEGALMLWMIAAQQMQASGKNVPTLSSAKMDMLRQPQTSIGHIAYGRWLWWKHNLPEAEVEFRQAFAQASEKGHLSKMLWASEALIELQLERGDIKSAEKALGELQGYDPLRMDQDYRVNLLNLRVALALGRKTDIAAAYKKTEALAGERALPLQILAAYRTAMRI